MNLSSSNQMEPVRLAYFSLNLTLHSETFSEDTNQYHPYVRSANYVVQASSCTLTSMKSCF